MTLNLPLTRDEVFIVSDVLKHYKQLLRVYDDKQLLWVYDGIKWDVHKMEAINDILDSLEFMKRISK